MHTTRILLPVISILAAFAFTRATTQDSTSCTSAQRIAGAERVPYTYNLIAAGASAAAFEKVPFAPDCVVLLYANGLPGVEVADTDTTTRAFATTTRQLFSKVTGQYVDFANGTTDVMTNVTLGALHSLPIPFTFYAKVYLDYSLASCEIEAVRAFADIPSEVLGEMVNAPQLSDVTTIPIT